MGDSVTASILLHASGAESAAISQTNPVVRNSLPKADLQIPGKKRRSNAAVAPPAVTTNRGESVRNPNQPDKAKTKIPTDMTVGRTKRS